MNRRILKYSPVRRRRSFGNFSYSLRRSLFVGVRAFALLSFLAIGGVALLAVFCATPLFAEDAIVEELVVEQTIVPSKGLTPGKEEDRGVVVVSGSEPFAEEPPVIVFKEKWEGNKFERRHNKYLKYDKNGQVDASPEVIPLDYLPRDNAGFIDWTKAMREGLIQPSPAISAKRGEQMQTVRYDEDVVLRPSKTFMPDVIFPHDAHNDWLNCGNCHDGIFKMKKKASGISMKRIWKGEFCGRCHDKVAFPLRHCFRCHAGERAAKFAKPEPIRDNYIEYEEY